MPSVKRLLPATLVALAALAGTAHAATITEFPLTPSDRQPMGIALAPGGNLWFGELGASNLGTLHRDGAFTEKMGLSARAWAVAVTPAGDVWATEPGAQEIAHVTPGGMLSEPGAAHNGVPWGITAAPDGDIWYTQSSPSKIERIGSTTAEYTPTTSGNQPTAITSASDGSIWFTESANPARIGEITPGGVMSEHSTGLTANSDPTSITAGPDGNLWFTESTNPGRIGRITPAGVITEYTTGLTANSNPTSITAGPDGNLWFTESANPGRIGRLTPDAPTTATQAASAVTPTTATLAGTVNPNSAATSYHFEFGTTTAYGQRSPAADAVVGADSAAHAVNQSLSGLLASTTYHYRLVATSGAGTAYGADATFTTAAAPSSLTTTTNPIATPPAAPASPAPPAPPAPPVLGRSAVAGVVSGTVLVRIPGSSTLQTLAADRNIPMGSLINTTHGVVKLTDATDHKGHTQSAIVWAGSFVMTQARSGRGLTTFRLTGPLSCPSPHGMTTDAARSSAPVRLWGKDNHGRYSTRGRNSVATVRGTVWETVESCAGTRTVVKRGLVSVRDLHRHTSVLVRAGHSYLAKP